MFGNVTPPPFLLNPDNFDAVIAQNGTRLAWSQGHACPCTNTGGGQSGSGIGIAGSGRPDCLTCFGYGIYWDAPTAPFVGLLTEMNMNRSPDEQGSHLNNRWGLILTGSPSITVPYSASPEVWTNASTNDLMVEIDATTRFSTILTAGVNQYLPYVQNMSVASSGAVTYWNSATQMVTSVAYTVSENQVVPTGLPQGTPYTVDFFASPTFMLIRKPGGLPHTRPFGGNLPRNEPRRFQAINLDIWSRLRSVAPSTAPNVVITDTSDLYLINQVVQR